MKLSTTYNVQAGDTFDRIARRTYGDESGARLIARANPGVAEPLQGGTVLTIPDFPGAPQDLQQAGVASNPNETAILINGKRFRFWDSVRIQRSLDAMDIVEFGAPLDVDLPGFKDAFRPFKYKPTDITVNGAPLFTGAMVSPVPVIDTDRKVVSVSAYSLPGVLNDCTSPASAFPLEFNGQNLREISNTLAEPFGLSVILDDAPGAVFERVAAEPGQRVLAFLIGLAQQRNLVVSSTQRGELLFQRSADAGEPTAQLVQGVSPLLKVTPFFTPQEYYSDLTGVEPVVVGSLGSQFTVKNPLLKGVVRPLTFKVNDTKNADLKSAVQAKAGRMFGNMVSYSIGPIPTWRDANGELWEPNKTVSLHAPDVFVFEPYNFIIRSVEFFKDKKSETATLNVVIPGSFSGKVPEKLPWD